VPHRHLHIIHSALKHSDKPFMGIVTARERAADTMHMAGLVFGHDFVRDNTVLTSVVNCNSPLVWDATMLDALKVYAAHNQPCLLSPFALCGASTPASTVGSIAQVNAEALAGLAFTQLVRPGSPQVYGQFMVTIDMKTGAPMGGAPEAAHMTLVMGALARKYAAVPHLGLPCRLQAQRRAGRLRGQSADARRDPVGGQLHLARRGMARGGAGVRLLEVRHRRRTARGLVQICPRRVAGRSRPGHGGGARGRPRRTLSRHEAHAGALRERVLHAKASWTSTPSSSGRRKARRTMTRAAGTRRKAMLAGYEEPALDEASTRPCATSSLRRERELPAA
jgi:trimethylamine:corrinoid methyltransferase-like protein